MKKFIAGMFTVLLVIPTANKLLELTEVWIEACKIKPTKKILESQKDTLLLREFLYQPPEENIEYDYEFYEEEDD